MTVYGMVVDRQSRREEPLFPEGRSLGRVLNAGPAKRPGHRYAPRSANDSPFDRKVGHSRLIAYTRSRCQKSKTPHKPTMKIPTSSFLILAVLGNVSASPAKRWPSPSPPLKLNQYDQEIFDVAMQLGDWSWEPSTGYIEANDDGVSRISVPAPHAHMTDSNVGSHEYQVHRLVCTWPALS